MELTVSGPMEYSGQNEQSWEWGRVDWSMAQVGSVDQGDIRPLTTTWSCVHPGMQPVSTGAVHNTSSLFTYDSWFLINNFLYQPKHDPTFEPLFPDKTTLSPSQAEEAAKLCGNDAFCNFDVAATGSLSVGNATLVAHQLHQQRIQRLQPGEGWGEEAWASKKPPCTRIGLLGLASCRLWPAT